MTIHGLPAPLPPVNGAQAAQPIPSRKGQEPTIWSMLSPAERAFFLPGDGEPAVGYGPGGTATPTAPVLGQQLDVRG